MPSMECLTAEWRDEHCPFERWVNTMPDTFQQLCSLLRANYEIAAGLIQPETNLEDLGIDSIGSIELFWLIEDEFNVQVGLDNVRLSTIAEVVKYIDQLVARQRHGGQA